MFLVRVRSGSDGQEPEFRGPWVIVGDSQGPDSVKENHTLCPWETRVLGMMEMSLRLLHGPLSKPHSLSPETSGFHGESSSFVGDRRKGEEIAWAPGVMGRVCGY